MSETTALIVGGLLSGGFLLLGLFIGHWLERSSEKKKEFEVAKVELYDRLYKVYAGVSLLMAVGVTLPNITNDETREYRENIHSYSTDIMALLLRNEFPESESMLRLVIQVRLRNYTKTVAKGLEVVLAEHEKSIKNQTYLMALKAVIEEDEESKERKLLELAKD